MKKKTPRAIYKWFPIIIVPIATILVSFVLSEVQGKVGTLTVIIGTLIVLSALVLTLLSANALFSVVVSNQIEEVIKSKATQIALEAIRRYDEKSQLAQLISSKLYTLNQLLEYEETQEIDGCKIVEVQIITASFKYDVPEIYGLDSRFIDVVQRNVREGIKYRYYITNSAENIMYIEDLRRLTNDGISYQILNDDFFFLVENFDFTIYTVIDQAGHRKRIGFMPLSSTMVSNEDKTVNLYHTEISPELINKLLGKLIEPII